jgi:hypothetical protein
MCDGEEMTGKEYNRMRRKEEKRCKKVSQSQILFRYIYSFITILKILRGRRRNVL